MCICRLDDSIVHELYSTGDGAQIKYLEKKIANR